MNCAEARELITALVDHELHGSERSQLESHLKDCARCQSILAQEQLLKREVHAEGAKLHAPADLKEKILSDRRIFPEQAEIPRRWTSRGWLADYVLRPAVVSAVLLIVGLPSLYLLNQRSQPISLAALETYSPFLRGDLPMITAQSADEIKEQLMRAAGGSFEPMGYDLSAMNLEPVAGAVREMKGRKVLIAIYRGQGLSLICYTFLGTEEDAPANAAVFFDPGKKMNFYAFSQGGINVVFHREGGVICILASQMPMQDLLALARAHARPA